jgi:hypothetical protein
MKRIIQLKPGHYLELDSYRRAFLSHMRPQLSPTTAIFAAFTLVISLTYAIALPRFVSDAATYQSAPQTQRRIGSNR